MSTPAKMVTLTATPSASERAATRKRPGACRSERRAYLRSWRSGSIELVGSGQWAVGGGEWTVDRERSTVNRARSTPKTGTAARTGLRSRTATLLPRFQGESRRAGATLPGQRASQEVKRSTCPGGTDVTGAH